MAEEITVRDNDEFEEIIANHDIRVARALVETILKNLKGRKRHLHALSVMVLNEATIYDITIDRKEFITTLEKNLPIYEKNELYEKCAEIVEAIKKHAEGHIAKHKANVEVLLEKTAGIAEHPDTLETIEKELKIIAEYDDELEMLNKYF